MPVFSLMMGILMRTRGEGVVVYVARECALVEGAALRRTCRWCFNPGRLGTSHAQMPLNLACNAINLCSYRGSHANLSLPQVFG